MAYQLIVYRHPNRAWAVPRVVETLEEARYEALAHIVNSHDAGDTDGDWEQCEVSAQQIPQSGGKVGPLPDGYVIEVRRLASSARRA